MQKTNWLRESFLWALCSVARAGKCTTGVSDLPDTYAIFISAGLDSFMHVMDEERNARDISGAERSQPPVHPGAGILRRAIRANIVSFPSQIAGLPTGSRAEAQWRMVLLFFVRGWSVPSIAARFQVPRHRVWTLLNGWCVRAMALGQVQVIDAEAFEACCRGEAECGAGRAHEEKRLAEVRPLVKIVPDALPGAAKEVRAAEPVAWDEVDESADLIAALDAAAAHCEEWRGEFWLHLAAHLRDLRAAVSTALELGRFGGRADGFFTAQRSGKSGLKHELQVRDEERVSHAVA